jgi:aminoglycoside phosphotransferase (APT) family kinase protein
MFMSTTHETLHAFVQQVLGGRMANLRITSRPSLEYQSNQLYDLWADGRHLILKMFLKPEEQAVAPLREFRALELLADFDIAPQPIFYDPARGPVVIYEYMDGEMWDRYRPSVPELAQLAELWLKMNSMPTDKLWLSRGYDQDWDTNVTKIQGWFQTYAAWAADEFKPGERVADLSLELLARSRPVIQELSACEPLLCFCRADPRFANVIRRPDGRLGLIDWEDSGLRDPARDLADLLTHPNQEDLLTMPQWQAFLRPYLAARGQLDGQMAHRMQLYLAIFPLFWLALLLGQGVKLTRTQQTSGWMINSLPANVRLRNYLARALAWPALDFSEQLNTIANLDFFPSENSA